MSYQTEFDNQKFQAAFNEMIKKNKMAREKAEQEKLDSLTTIERQKKLHELSMLDVLVYIKNSVFGILRDLLTLHWSKDMFTKEDRILYIGILLLFIDIMLYLFDHI